MKANINHPCYVIVFAAVVSAAFTGAIMSLLDRPDLRAMGEQAAARAMQMTWQSVAQRYVSLFRRCRSGPGTP